MRHLGKSGHTEEIDAVFPAHDSSRPCKAGHSLISENNYPKLSALGYSMNVAPLLPTTDEKCTPTNFTNYPFVPVFMSLKHSPLA